MSLKIIIVIAAKSSMITEYRNTTGDRFKATCACLDMHFSNS
jgi:hypothetical protein